MSTKVIQAGGGVAESDIGMLQLDIDPGANAGDRRLTRATTDHEAVSGWLQKYLDSPHTLESYRKEAERLLLWCGGRGITLSQLMVEDVQDYKEFLLDPQPREQWCLIQEPRMLADGNPNPAWRPVQKQARTLKNGLPNPAWRPFQSGLSESAAKQAATVLFGLGEYLAAIGYLGGNPFRAARKHSSAPAKTIERYLERDAWQVLSEHIETLSRATPRAEAHYHRARFVFRFLYLTGLRREEFVSVRCKDIKSRHGKYFLHVLGKGNKEGLVPLNNDAVTSIREYRTSLGLSPWPEYGDTSPLLRSITGKNGLSVKMLHDIVKKVAGSCPDARVRGMSAHWLRHTAATRLLESGLSMPECRDMLRHANVSTTSLYSHSEQDELHDKSQNHRV